MKYMKASVLAVLVLAMVLVGRPSVSQAEGEKSNLSSNLFNVFIGIISAEYEMFNSTAKMGYYATVRYGSYKIGGTSVDFPGGSVGLRFYPGGTAPEGFFVGPLLYVNFMSAETKGIDAVTGLSAKAEMSGAFFGPMVGLGYRWNWGGFTFAPAFQVGFITGKAEAEVRFLGQSAKEEIDFSGVLAGIGLNMGWAW